MAATPSPLLKKVCLVTGGSRGFGAGIAKQLSAMGAEVWVTGRSERQLHETAQRIGAIPVVADATSSSDWKRTFGQILEVSGKIDILVNNVGAGIRIAPLQEQTDEEIRHSISTNLTSTILGCRHAAGLMSAARSGLIINISSVCARVAWPGWSVYSAGKAGLLQFGKCLYAELRPRGVRVTTLIPSWGATDFNSSSGLPNLDPTTLGQTIQPQELGDIIVSLCQLPPHLNVQDITVWPTVQDLPCL